MTSEQNSTWSLQLNAAGLAKLAVGLWLIAATAYFVWDRWEHFKANAAEEAYKNGQADAVKRVIQQAQNCQPFDVYAGEKRVQLIEIGCLKRGAQRRNRATAARQRGQNVPARPAPPRGPGATGGPPSDSGADTSGAAPQPQ